MAGDVDWRMLEDGGRGIGGRWMAGDVGLKGGGMWGMWDWRMVEYREYRLEGWYKARGGVMGAGVP